MAPLLSMEVELGPITWGGWRLSLAPLLSMEVELVLLLSMEVELVLLPLSIRVEPHPVLSIYLQTDPIAQYTFRAQSNPSGLSWIPSFCIKQDLDCASS